MAVAARGWLAVVVAIALNPEFAAPSCGQAPSE